MKFKFNLLALLIALVWTASPLCAQAQTDPFPAVLEDDLSKGTSAIYLLDFETAHSRFRHAMELDPGHPAAYFFDLMCTWHELTYDSLVFRDAPKEKRLEDQADLASRKAESFAKNPETSAVGYLYWGGALGAKGWYHVTRGNWVRAYLSGKKGYNYMQKVLEIDPHLYDAYLGVGMFEYYAATLGPTLKALASFAVRGDKDVAAHYLTLAQTRSRYVRLEAAYFLWNAALDEGRLEDALARALEFKKTIPESPFFRWCEIFTLFRMKKWREMLEVCDEYFALAYAGPQPRDYVNPFEKLLSKILYHCGLAAYRMGNVHLAKEFFEKTIDQKAKFQGWKVLAYLRRGEIFDLEGKRTEAIVKYRAVLKYPDVYDSRKTARARIRHPYQRYPDGDSGILNAFTPLEPRR